MSSNPAPKRRRTAAFYKPGKFDCCNCRRDVRGETHVRHKERDQFVLCTDCYTVGAEGVSGVKWNADTVNLIDTSTTRMPLLAADWSADHEVRLLEGILQYGFGNWRAVAEHLGFEKTEQECEDHYERFYLRSKKFPLPDLEVGPVEVTAAAVPAASGGRGVSPVADASGGRDASPVPDVAMADAALEAAEAAPAEAAPAPAPASAASASTARPKDGKPKQERRGASGLLLEAGEGPAAADLVGYMPLRGEFDTECAPSSRRGRGAKLRSP